MGSEVYGMITEKQALGRLRRAVDATGGIQAFSRVHNISAGNLSRVLRGIKPLTEKYAGAVGLHTVAAFVSKGGNK